MQASSFKKIKNEFLKSSVDVKSEVLIKWRAIKTIILASKVKRLNSISNNNKVKLCTRLMSYH